MKTDALLDTPVFQIDVCSGLHRVADHKQRNRLPTGRC